MTTTIVTMSVIKIAVKQTADTIITFAAKETTILDGKYAICQLKYYA